MSLEYRSAVEPARSMASRQVAIDAYGQLTAAILRNDIPPASRININAVATSLGASPTPVREALAKLEADGLVTQTHLKGYRTTDLLTRSEIEDLWEFRLLIEPYGAGRAAEQATDDQLKALRLELTTVPAIPAENTFDSYRQFSAHDERLHTSFLRMAGNDVVLTSFQRTHCHLHAFRLAYNTAAGVATLEEHTSIGDRIEHRDAGGATEAMRHHLIESRDRLLPFARANCELQH